MALVSEQTSAFLGEEKTDSTLEIKDKKERLTFTGCLKSNLFLILTVAGIVAGFVIGLTVRRANPSSDALLWIGMPGEIFMRILSVVILPLLVCSVIDGTSSIDSKSCGRISLVSLGYIIITNAIGGILGVVLAVIIEPGHVVKSGENDVQPDTRDLQTQDIFADFIRNMFPDNIVKATLQMSITKYIQHDVVVTSNITGHLRNLTISNLSRTSGYVSGTNLLGLIIVSTALGLTASQVGENARPFTSFFRAGAIIIFKLFGWIKWTTPVGVASLIAVVLADIDDIGSAFASMGVFIATVSGTNLCYQLLFLPLVYFIFTRRNPFKFLLSISKPCMMAFGPPSSKLPMPEMMQISTDVYGIDPRVVNFVLPMSVTINRDGSTLFISAACIYVAQQSGLPLDAGKILIIGVLSILSSLTIPPVPSGSVVTVLIILDSLGIPSSNMGLILAVDWLNDRVRSVANLVSHMVSVHVTWALCKKTIKEEDLKSANGNTSMEICVP